MLAGLHIGIGLIFIKVFLHSKISRRLWKNSSFFGETVYLICPTILWIENDCWDIFPQAQVTFKPKRTQRLLTPISSAVFLSSLTWWILFFSSKLKTWLENRMENSKPLFNGTLFQVFNPKLRTKWTILNKNRPLFIYRSHNSSIFDEYQTELWNFIGCGVSFESSL